MERARATWTDERLDDLSRRVDDGFNRVDARFNALEGRVDSRFNAFEARMDSRFNALEARIDALQRLMIQFGGGTLLAVLATLVSVLLTRA